MIDAYNIERIARLVICGIIPLIVLCVCIFLVCKKDNRCSFDFESICDEYWISVHRAAWIILLWLIAYVVLNRLLYRDFETWLQTYIENANQHVVRWVVKGVFDTLVLVIGCKMLLKICIYPDLAFRVVVSQSRKKKQKNKRGKMFYQFETQFWNAGLCSLHNLNVTLTKWIRNKQGNIESHKVAMHDADGDAYIENIFHKQDDRAYNWSSCEDKWEVNKKEPCFEYLELTVASRVRVFNTKKELEISETKRFYPFDIHQGDFRDVDNIKKVPQPLVTSYNNQQYVSAKRTIQKWDEGLRIVQCLLLLLYIICAIVATCGNQCDMVDLFALCQRIAMSSFFILAAWRVLLKTPIRSVITPSYIYGSQQ